MTRTIVVAAGGTGGHVMPALALAGALHAAGDRVVFASDPRGEVYLKTFYGTRLIYDITYMDGTLAAKARVVWKILKATLQAVRDLHRLRPSLVIGFGGFASFPSLVAAWILHVPRMLHQADAVVGQTNRWLAHISNHLALSFQDTQRIPGSIQGHTTVTGLPLRAAVISLAGSSYVPSSDGPFRLLITGGSQSADFFATLMPDVVATLPEVLQKRLVISHQCRDARAGDLKEAYAATHATVEVAPFFDDISKRLQACHLLMGRSGASTLLEAATAGRPLIMVPYPHAKEDHQTVNAQKVVDVKGGWLFPQKTCTADDVSAFMMECMSDPNLLKAAAQNITVLSCSDATTRLKNVIDMLIGKDPQ